MHRTAAKTILPLSALALVLCLLVPIGLPGAGDCARSIEQTPEKELLVKFSSYAEFKINPRESMIKLGLRGAFDSFDWAYLVLQPGRPTRLSGYLEGEAVPGVSQRRSEILRLDGIKSGPGMTWFALYNPNGLQSGRGLTSLVTTSASGSAQCRLLRPDESRAFLALTGRPAQTRIVTMKAPAAVYRQLGLGE